MRAATAKRVKAKETPLKRWKCQCGSTIDRKTKPHSCPSCGVCGAMNVDLDWLRDHAGLVPLSAVELGRRHLSGDPTVKMLAAAHEGRPVGGFEARPGDHGLLIDGEIRDLIEPLTPHERGTLKANVERDGCRDALVGWKETGILLDGHNRREICEAHKPDPIPVVVEWLSFPNREAAIAWVLAHQLGRRNITPEHRAYLIGKRLETESKGHGGNRKSSPQNGALKGRTSERIAKEANTSKTTVERNGIFSKAVDKLVAHGVKRDSLTGGKIKFSQYAALKVLDLSPAKLRATAERIKNGTSNVEAALPPEARPTIKPPAKAKKAGPAPGPDPSFFNVLETIACRLGDVHHLLGNGPASPNVREGIKRLKELIKYVETERKQ